MINILVWICLIAFISCEWERAVILANNGTFKNQHTFVDPVTGTAHVVFMDEIKSVYKFGYVNMDKNKKVSDVKWLSDKRGGSAEYSCAITGAKDGKHLYVVMELMDRAAEIYVTESTDEGATWSDPEVARTNNLNDVIYRMHPMILYVEGVGLQVIYNKNGNQKIPFTSRKPLDGTWGNEEAIDIGECNSLDNSLIFGFIAVKQKDGKYVYVFSVKCQYQYMLVIGESYDNGKTWNVSNIKRTPNSYSANAILLSIPGAPDRAFIGIINSVSIAPFNARIRIAEYFPGFKLDDLVTFEMRKAYFVSMDYLKRNGKTELVTFASDRKYENDDSIVNIMTIPLDEPWKYQRIPSNYQDAAIFFPSIHVCDDKLLHVGLSTFYALTAQRYDFK